MFILTMTFCVVFSGGVEDCGTRIFDDYLFESHEACTDGAVQLTTYLAFLVSGRDTHASWLCLPPGEMAVS